MRERRLGEDVVRDPMRKLRERVRRARRDDENVGACQMEVDVVLGRAPSKGTEGLGGDEALGVGTAL